MGWTRRSFIKWQQSAGIKSSLTRRDDAVTNPYEEDEIAKLPPEFRELARETLKKLPKRAYVPETPYNQMCDHVENLELDGRTENGERYPEKVRDSLDKLSSMLNNAYGSDSIRAERAGVANALSALRETRQAFEDYGLKEPKLLIQLQIDLTRRRNELDPGQSLDRPC